MKTIGFILMVTKGVFTEELTSTEVPVSGDGTIEKVGLSWGVRGRESESQEVS